MSAQEEALEARRAERERLEAELLRAQIAAQLAHAAERDASRHRAPVERELWLHGERERLALLERSVGLHAESLRRTTGLGIAGLLVQAAGVVVLGAIALALWGAL